MCVSKVVTFVLNKFMVTFQNYAYSFIPFSECHVAHAPNVTILNLNIPDKRNG